MRTMITGAGGMVGSHMVELLFNEGHDVFGTYYRPTTDLGELPAEIEMIECDVRYPQHVERIIAEKKPSRIFHLAAQSFPTVSWERPYETLETNVNGTAAVFEAVKACRKCDSTYNPMVVVACSSAEYGQTLDELDDPHVTEEAQLKPLHPYGVSKVCQDLLAFQYYMNDGIRCIRARIFNSTGTRKINDVTSDFTKRAIIAERTGNYELRVGNLDSYRAIMDQRDLVNALLLLSEKGAPGEAYNISSANIYQIRDIVRMIESQIGHSFDLIVDPALLRSTDERIIVGDISKLRSATGWEQMIPMEQTIADMLDYWRRKLSA